MPSELDPNAISGSFFDEPEKPRKPEPVDEDDLEPDVRARTPQQEARRQSLVRFVSGVVATLAVAATLALLLGGRGKAPVHGSGELPPTPPTSVLAIDAPPIPAVPVLPAAGAAAGCLGPFLPGRAELDPTNR